MSADAGDASELMSCDRDDTLTHHRSNQLGPRLPDHEPNTWMRRRSGRKGMDQAFNQMSADGTILDPRAAPAIT